MSDPSQDHSANSIDPLAAAFGPGEVSPSAAFSDSVMREVRCEADQLKGLRCPWRLALGAGVFGTVGAWVVPLSTLASVTLACLCLPLVLVAILATVVAGSDAATDAAV